ncbi:hypothetical protein N6H13_01200 [Paenibacillus sp. CC-CFT742]|nr:hypothetical protein [Paenibacillus sp. CC-CFT742]WJH29446.1 hypothetical protein N6H13_01200 [Paenibacillus sp. CC-CFT742]
MRTLKLSVVVAASLTIGGVIFSLPSGTQAVSPFVQSIKDWGNGMKSIIIEDRTAQLGADPSTAKTLPPLNRDLTKLLQLLLARRLRSCQNNPWRKTFYLMISS